jgi:hypothetical protein
MIPPPIKRPRILVSGGVVIVISVKLYNKICGCDVCGCAYPAGNPRVPVFSDQRQKVALCAANKIGRPLTEMLLRNKLATLHFRL